MTLDELYSKALNFEMLTIEEGMTLFEQAPLTELMFVANEMRKKQVPHGKVTWQIDRNVNTTNVCIANCKFCNFYRIPGHAEAYITDIDTYKRKIEETFRWGGDQLLLQGGHHPQLGLQFYVDLFKQLKQLYPTLKLHTLGPPEVAHITKLEKSTHREVLIALKEAGMDSLPGAGAVGGAVGGSPEVTQRQHGGRLPVLNSEKGRQAHGSSGQQPKGQATSEPVLSALDDAGRQRREGGGAEYLARHVQPAAAGFGGIPDRQQGEHDDERGDGQVDDEHRWPAEGVG